MKLGSSILDVESGFGEVEASAFVLRVRIFVFGVFTCSFVKWGSEDGGVFRVAFVFFIRFFYFWKYI